nr:hypothetical protein [Tanacetum cinerariifolium]
AGGQCHHALRHYLDYAGNVQLSGQRAANPDPAKPGGAGPQRHHQHHRFRCGAGGPLPLRGGPVYGLGLRRLRGGAGV